MRAETSHPPKHHVRLIVDGAWSHATSVSSEAACVVLLVASANLVAPHLHTNQQK